MGKNEQKQKDAAMAARLKKDTYHKGEAVRRRKERRFKEFMARLQNK